jgi:copper oxidase (laccase) domain-containing protein
MNCDAGTVQPVSFERFPALLETGVSGLDHAFVLRVPGVDVAVEKPDAMRRLNACHRLVVEELGWGGAPVVTAEQVHGANVAVVDEAWDAERVAEGVAIAGVDGLVTTRRGFLLGIVVADCCAVYVVDRVRGAIGLLHAGKRGTEAEILSRALDLMISKFGSDPGDLLVQLSPCIRPPAYEVDIPASLVRQALGAGIVRSQIHDCGVCTTSDPSRYYSYRLERGKTGRMLALLGMRDLRVGHG